MPKAELVDIKTEEELLQWALVHNGHKEPYLMRALIDNDIDDTNVKSIDDVIIWILRMRERFPKYYKTENMCTYLAGVCITVNMEAKPHDI